MPQMGDVEPRRSHLEMRVFGSTVALVDGFPVDLGRRQVRQVVTALAGTANRALSADALIELLWPVELPANPRKALNVVLSRLRSALGPCADRLVAESSGYRLIADAVDVDHFVDGVELARSLEGREAVAVLEDALATWTGEPFADDLDAVAVADRRSSLIELRWFALTRLAERYVEFGEAERAVALTGPLLDDDAIRERLVIAHATALARSGRKADALAVTAQAIGALRERHGLEPSSALVDAERAILTGSSELEPTRNAAQRPTADVFVGRDDELSRLEGVRPGVVGVVVAGAGAGKSTLLDRFVETRSSDGVAVVRVDVAPMPDRPFDAVAQVCRQLSSVVGLDGLSADTSAALARICPQLGLRASTALTRSAMVDRLVDFIETSATGTTPEILFVFDDAQWLDSGSAEVVEQLVGNGRVALVAASRPSELPLLERVASASADRVIRLALAPLSRADVASLAAACSTRSMGDDQLDRLAERAGGNALFLRLLLDRWADGGGLDDELPSSVLVSVRERLDELSRSAVQTLEVVALAARVGGTSTVHTVRQLRPNADVELAAAVGAGLVVVDDITDTVRFVHALVADACDQLLAGGRRVSIHDELGRVLENDGAPAPEYARHYIESASIDPIRAVWACLRAVADFVAGFDWQTALRFLDEAERIVEREGIDDLGIESEIAVRRGTVGRALGLEGYVDDLARGCDLARRADDPTMFAIAVTELCGHGATTAAGAVDERVRPLLVEALDLDVAPALRAELCAAASSLFAMSADAGRGRELYREAWDLVSTLDDPEIERAVVARAHLGFGHPDDFEHLVAAARRMTELAGGDPELVWESAFVRFQTSAVVGEVAAAAVALDEMRRYAPLVTRRPREFGLAFSESAFATLVGDLEAAEAHAASALEIGLARFDESWAMTVYGLLLLGIRREQGRLDELAGAVEAMVASSPDYLPFRAVSAMVATETGDHVLARRELDVIAVDGFSHIEQDMHYTAVLTLLATATAAVGDRDEIDALWDLLLPFRGRMSWNTASSCGPVDAGLALVAEARGDHGLAGELQSSADALVASFRTSVADALPLQTATS